MKQFTISIGEGIGELAKVTEALANHGVNILAISLEGNSRNTKIRIVTSDEKTTKSALKRINKDYTINETIILKLMDRPGELAKIARRLSRNGIKITSLYILERGGGKTQLAISVDKLKKAKDILKIG